MGGHSLKAYAITGTEFDSRLESFVMGGHVFIPYLNTHRNPKHEHPLVSFKNLKNLFVVCACMGANGDGNLTFEPSLNPSMSNLGMLSHQHDSNIMELLRDAEKVDAVRGPEKRLKGKAKELKWKRIMEARESGTN